MNLETARVLKSQLDSVIPPTTFGSIEDIFNEQLGKFDTYK